MGESVDQQNYNYSLTEAGVIIHQYWGQEENLAVPDILADCPVVALDKEALSRRNLKAVYLPDTIQNIGCGALQNNPHLLKVRLPSSLKRIPESLFFGCRSLKELIIPAEVQEVGSEAFLECVGLEKVIFQGVNCQLSPANFYKCFSLQEIKLPEQIEVLPPFLFAGCESLIRIELPASVRKIGEGLFNRCTALQELVLPPQITEIPNQCLEYCTSLTRLIIPEQVHKLGDYSLSWCSNLSELKLPSALRDLGFKALLNCRGLTELEFPEGLEVLPGGAVDKCSGLKSIVISSSIRQIDNAFMPLEATLEQIKVKPNNQVYADREGVLFSADYRVLLEYPCGRREQTYAIPEGTEILGNGAFYGNQFLRELIFPASLRRIERDALAESRLNKLEIPLTVQEIGLGCFRGIKEVFIYDNLDLSGKIKAGNGFLNLRSRQNGEILYRIWLGAGREDSAYSRLLGEIFGQKANLDGQKLDDYFPRLQNPANQYRLALARLEYPWELSSKAEQVYRDFWQEHWEKILADWIKRDNLDDLLTAEKLGLLGADKIQALIEVANSRQAFKFVTELLNYQNQHFELSEDDWDI